MVIEVPTRLAAKLRRLLADLEIPESSLEQNALEFLAALLEDDDILVSGWIYADAQQAERVAYRVFAREQITQIEIMFGDPANPTAVKFINSACLKDGPGWSWSAELLRAIQHEPERYRVLTSPRTVEVAS